MSTSDYDARYLDVWKDGATRRVPIPVDSINAAVTLRQRLYRMRQEMKRENHPLYETAKRAAVSIQIKQQTPDRSWITILFSSRKATPIDESAELEVEVVIQPQDNSFDKALEEAGYKTPGPPSLE